MKKIVKPKKKFVSNIEKWGQCKKHPRYEGKRKPTADCQSCRSLYNSLKERW